MSVYNNYKTSLLIPSQLPEYIRDDPSYSKFVDFLQSYYDWMDNEGGELYNSKNLLSYKDIDTTTDKFIDYFYNDFLVNFPQDIIADKNKLLKVAKQLYEAKGTPSSFKFLFRVLYNSDVDFFFTKEVVFKASSGKWYIAKSLKLSSSDLKYLETNNLRIFGETSKSIATIENSVVSKNKIEIFISNIERLFQSGEYVRIVDSNNQDVLFDGKVLRSKIVGQISQVNINPNYRGLLYKPNDPVIVYGGLNSPTDHGAVAQISETTTGAIRRIQVIQGGYGFREIEKDESGIELEDNINANTIIDIKNGGGAVASVLYIDPTANTIANVATIPIDYIGKKSHIKLSDQYYFRSNISANLQCTLANAFTFTSFSTYPLVTIRVDNGGGGIEELPQIKAISRYDTEGRYDDPEFIANNTFKAVLSDLGILAPIKIVSGGTGYVANDIIEIIGGSGVGAFANVLTVSPSTGAITSVGYVPNPNFIYPIGGTGYKLTSLPTLNVISSNPLANGASLYVPGILGMGDVLSPLVDRVGSISKIKLLDNGEDYISVPEISLKIQDIIVKGINLINPPVKQDIIYQGSSYENAFYKAYVDSYTLLVSDNDPTQSLYNLRVYNYNTKPSFNESLKIDGKSIMTPNNPYEFKNPEGTRSYDENGFISYGDGTAKATSKYLNGLVISDGVYLDDTGHPSSYNIIQDENYNNYTYQITLEKELSKYKTILLNLLHPTGMKVIGRFAMNSNNTVDMQMVEALNTGRTLKYHTGNPGSSLTMETTFTNPSNNIIKFSGLSGANIENIMHVGDTIRFTTTDGDTYSSIINNVVDGDANTVTISDNVFLTFANVAYINTSAGNSVINIVSLTNSYDIINNGEYTDPNYPLKDIVKVGDTILVNNTQKTVTSVNYVDNTITTNSNFTSNYSNSLMSVKRTWVATGNNIQIFGTIGVQYVPEITDELGNSITTEDDRIILLG